MALIDLQGCHDHYNREKQAYLTGFNVELEGLNEKFHYINCESLGITKGLKK